MTDKEVDGFLIELERSDYKITSFDKKIDSENFVPENAIKT